MPLEQGQVGGERLLAGFPILGNPTAALNTLQFDAVNNRFIWVANPANTFGRAVKIADQIVNNSSTFVNDDILFMPLEINRTYGFLMHVFITSGSTPDYKYDFAIPAGAAGFFQDGSWSSSADGGTQDITTTQPITTIGSFTAMQIMGYIAVAGTAGNLQYRWAQQTANASDTTTHLGSFMTVWASP